MKHTFLCHSSTPNFLYPCGISGCIQTFKTFSAISSHIQRKHQFFDPSSLEADISIQHEVEERCDERDEDMLSNPDGVNGEATVPSGSGDNQVAASTDKLVAQKSSALLLLTLKERHRLTQSAMDFTVGQMKQMVHFVLEGVKQSVQATLGDKLDVDIDLCFDVDPFQELTSEYLQTKFFRDHFNLIVCYGHIVMHVCLECLVM